MPAIYTKGKKYGASSQTVKELTKAEYDALTEEQKKNGIIYMVTDEDSAEDIHVVNEVRDDEYTVPSSKVVYGLAHNNNLLDNPFFTVAQAGYGGNHGSVAYVADRWKCGRILSSFDNGLSITWNGEQTFGWMLQKLEDSLLINLRGKVVTLSVDLNGTVISHSFTYPNGVTYETQQMNGITFFINDTGDNNVGIRFYSTSAYVVRSMKLEYGSISTLANDSAPDYATELLKCQRYCWVVAPSASSMGVTPLSSHSSNACYGVLLYPVPMRATPTVSLRGALTQYRVVGKGAVANPTAITSQNANTQSVEIYISGSFTTGNTYFLRIDNGASILVSADL